MKYLWALFFVLLFGTALAQGGEDWLAPVPEVARSASPRYTLPQDSFREVFASKAGVAESDLVDRTFRHLDRSGVTSYVGNNFHCKGKRLPYLVRAIYGFGGTGGYSVRRMGSALLVSHISLGHRKPAPTKSALVVCLRFQPTMVYVSYGVAR